MKSHYLLFAAALVATSCDERADVPRQPVDAIVFGVMADHDVACSRGVAPVGNLLLVGADGDSVAVGIMSEPRPGGAPMSRGVPVSGFDSFQAYAFYYADAAAVPVPFFTNETVSGANDAGWTTASRYYWPGTPGAALGFWAVAGHGASDGVSLVAAPGRMMLDCRVPAEASRQADVMVAWCDPISAAEGRHAPVPLAFRHIFAAVRFVAGSEMQPGRVKSVSVSGVASTGRYDRGEWGGVGEPVSYSIVPDTEVTGGETQGAPLAPADMTLMMIPQTLGGSARLEVVFEADGGTERVLTASLGGQQWRQGVTTVYAIGVKPDYTLDVAGLPAEIDAHYVISQGRVDALNLPPGRSWTLTASADDGADVTLQAKSQANVYALQGFWTDRLMRNNQITSESARGTESISGTGPVDFLLFIPENTGDNSRTVSLTLNIDGYDPALARSFTVMQPCPAWTPSGWGWENHQESNAAQYGFDWDRKVALIYPYRIQVAGNYSESNIRKRINDIIDRYDAQGYTEIVKYSNGLFGGNRLYVLIDYSKANNLGSLAQSASDGLANTRDLNTAGGSAATNALEEAFLNTKKFESGAETEPAFRLPDSGDPAAVPRPSGTNNVTSGLLGAVLKKNRYYLVETRNDDEIGYSAYIRPEDIVWYAPAWQQFAALPGATAEAVTPAATWSSTASVGSDAYSGAGSAISRKTDLGVRAVRNR